LGLLTHAKATPESLARNRWLRGLTSLQVRTVIPEIVDYEIRRELLRMDMTRGMLMLETLLADPDVLYDPLTTRAMRTAAHYWAAVRRRGRPTADPKALDCDVILAAQATILAGNDDEVVVATTNVRHLSQFVRADTWQNIQFS
jgi:hypothetical protein